MKKILKFLLFIFIILCYVGCKNSNSYASSTVYGQITNINGTKITMLLGDFDDNNMNNPQMPNGGMTGNIPGEMNPGEMNPGEMPDGEKPGEMNPGEMPDGEKPGEMNPGEMPDGDIPGEMNPGELPNGNMIEGIKNNFTVGTVKLTIDISSAQIQSVDGTIDLKVEDIIKVVFDADGNPKTIELMNNNVLGDFIDKNFNQGTAIVTITENGTYANIVYESTGNDENALKIDGATVILESIVVDKNGGSSSNTENGDFYGINAGLLATNKANVTINGGTFYTDVSNGNAIFSYGEGTIVTIYNAQIVTEGNNSGGIQTTGGGETKAYNLDVQTSGSSSAAIRSDRGGGTVTVEEGTYITNGYNSPAVYSTAAITIKDAILKALNSEALVIEGDNSIEIVSSVIEGNMSNTYGTSSSINVHNIMLYQSMSGDASIGTATLKITDSEITNNNGDLIFVTNTDAIIYLENNIITNTEEYVLRITGNDGSLGWGTEGDNGANADLTLNNQNLEGNILVDTISSLKLTLENGSIYTGNIQLEQNGQSTENNINVKIDESSVWNLTGNVCINTLENLGTINYNGYTITLADGRVLK